MCANESPAKDSAVRSVLPGLSCEQVGGLILKKRQKDKDSNHSPPLPLPKRSLLGLDQLAKERRELEAEETFKTPRTRTLPQTEPREGRDYSFSNSSEKRSGINRDLRAVDRRYRPREDDTPGSLHGYRVKGRDRWQEQVRERDKRRPLYATTRHHRESERRETHSRRESSKRETGECTPTPDHRLRNQMLTPSRVTWDDNEHVSETVYTPIKRRNIFTEILQFSLAEY